MGQIRTVLLTDAQAIADIYNPYVRETAITFEEEPVSADAMRSRIEDIIAQGYPYIVYEGDDGAVVGYAYASQFRARHAYRFAAETSLYLKTGHTAQGLGSQLYTALIARCRGKYHSLLGVVTLPNAASEKLHERFGFTKCAHLRESGLKFGKWLDVGFWELLIEHSTYGMEGK
ncbi:GNAT domain-containing protein [Chytriomyces sp. MP71]|nr:GNAT domain-containing protein [Chytriomyces sp. MP71]